MTKIMSKQQSFLDLLNKIEAHFPLSYSVEINELFQEFTDELEKLTEYDEVLKSRLNRIWAERGFSLERHFSKQNNIQAFDFYPKYKKLMKFDTLMLKKVMHKGNYAKVVFVGSGPLPLSLKLLRINLPKEGYDIMDEAIELSKKSVPKDRFGQKITYQKANFFDIKLKEHKPIVIYIAGLIQNKKAGVGRLIKQLPKGSLIVIRTVANDKRNLLYERLSKNDFLKFGYVREFNPTKTSGIVNGMIVIEKK